MSPVTISLAAISEARLGAAAAEDLRAHRGLNGPRPRGTGQLIDLVAEAGLTGRGGGGFPAARKLAAVTQRGPVVIANGAEADPSSAKDRALLARAPHLVLDGLEIVMEAVGATEGYLYAAAPSLPAVRRALAERATAGETRSLRLVEAPARFVAGEETAAVAAVEGRPALPRDKTRLVVEAGVRGRPTLVQNVETLAHVALIARHGAGWFPALGAPDQPGTLLATVSRAGIEPIVVEVAGGTGLRALLDRTDQAREVESVLVGGYHGTWIPGGHLDLLTLAPSTLTAYGASAGTGAVVVLPEGRCGVAETARIVSYLAGESANQCGPCLNGLPALARAIQALAAGSPTAGEVTSLFGLVERRGACHHPDGVGRMVRSAFMTFADEVAQHQNGRCSTSMAMRRAT